MEAYNLAISRGFEGKISSWRDGFKKNPDSVKYGIKRVKKERGKWIYEDLKN